MKFSREKPPIYDTLHDVFGVDWNNVIITYGDTVHSKYEIDLDKEAHEAVHVNQQLAYGVEEWWERYLVDPEFRLQQELEAFKAEADFIRRHMKDRNVRARLIHGILLEISSSTYGNVITYDEAKQRI